MKLAFPIDGFLCDSGALESEWERKLGDEKFKLDASFWAACKPYEDTYLFLEHLLRNKYDFYVFACRPKSLLLPTRAWIRNHYGITLDKQHLVIPALKRYDCRLLGIDTYVDSDLKAIENMKIETVHPITTYHVDRTVSGALQHVIRRMNESFCD